MTEIFECPRCGMRMAEGAIPRHNRLSHGIDENGRVIAEH